MSDAHYTFLSLPPDVIEYLYSKYLSVTDRVVGRHICKKVRSVAVKVQNAKQEPPKFKLVGSALYKDACDALVPQLVWMLKHGCPADSDYIRGLVARAIHRDQLELLDYLISCQGFDVNMICTSDGRTPLFLAADNHYACVKRLQLQVPNIDVNLGRARTGSTALYMAVQRNALDIVELMLADGRFDVNSGRPGNITPLRYCAKHGFVRMAKLLRQDPKLDPNKGFSPLLTAIITNERSIEMVKFLLSFPELKLNIRLNGLTELHHAITWPEALKLLLNDERVDINALDPAGRSVLDKLALANAHDLVKEMVANPRLQIELILQAIDWLPQTQAFDQTRSILNDALAMRTQQ